MRNKINIAARILTIVIIVFGAVSVILIMTKSDATMSKNVALGLDKMGTQLDVVITGSWIILGITAASMIVFGLISMLKVPKKALMGLIGIGALAIISFVAYSLASPDIDPEFVDQMKKIDVDDSLSRIVGAGLIGTYFMAGLSVIAILYAWGSRMINKLLKR